MIKSGGEWISSIEIENLAMGHPSVAEAAVVAIPDSRWCVLLVCPGAPPAVCVRLASTERATASCSRSSSRGWLRGANRAPHPARLRCVVHVCPWRRGERPLLVVVLKPGLQGEGSSHESAREALFK